MDLSGGIADAPIVEALASRLAELPDTRGDYRAVRRYASPATYTHPQGAVIWAKLPLGPTKHCYFCDRAYPSSDPYHVICPEFPTGWDTPGLDDVW